MWLFILGGLVKLNFVFVCCVLMVQVEQAAVALEVAALGERGEELGSRGILVVV